jgi:hypothetical protein
MAPSLQERFGLRKKKIFDAFDDSSYMSEEEVGDLVDAPASAELYVSSLEPTQEDPEEDKEQAPLPPPQPLTNERAPSVLGRMLGKNPSSPRKSSKNSFQSATSRLTKTAQCYQSTDIASPPAAVAEDAPQTPAKLKHKSPKKTKRKSVQCKQSLLDSGSDESLSDDDGYRPSKGMTLLKPNRPKVLAVDNEVESSLSVGMGEVDKCSSPRSLEAPSLHSECDRAELSSSHSRGDHKERPTVLPAPSDGCLMDMALASQNDPNPSETTSAMPKRRGVRKGPSLHSECDHAELSSSHSRGDHKERPTVLPAPSDGCLMDMALASQNDPNPSETSSAKPKRRGVRKGPSLHSECGRAELSPSHTRGDHKERPSVLPAPSDGCLMDMALASQNDPSPAETSSAKPKRRGVREGPSLRSECDRAELSSSHTRGDHKERHTVLPAPSQGSLMDMALAIQNDPNPTETTSAMPKRRGVRRSNEPQGAQFRPSLMSADADADCESESVVPAEVDDGGYLPTPMGRRPSLLSAPSQSGDFIDAGDSTEDDDASESSLPAAPILDDNNKTKRDEKKDDQNSVIESQSVPNPSVVNASAKTKRNSGRRPKDSQPASDPDREGEASSDEDDDGYLPTSMASSKSSRPAILSALSQSSLTGNVFDNGDHNKDKQSSEPSPLADQSQASIDCSLSDLGPDGTNSGEDSTVFSLSALEKKKHSSPAKSLLMPDGDDSTSKLDKSLQALSMASGDREDGGQSNLFLAKNRQNKVKGPGEVDPSVRSTRSSLTFSVTVDSNGETQSINVDTRLPMIESPTKKTRDHNIQGDNKIADMSDIDAPSFAVKSTENSSRHSQRSRIALSKKQPKELPQIDLSEQESRSPPRQGSPRRQHLQQEHHSPKSPKTSRPSKSQSLHRRSKNSTPVEDVSKSGPSREQISMSQNRKMMKAKGDTRVHPGPLLGDDDVNQTDQGRENKASARADKSEKSPASRRQLLRAMTKETGIVEENVSPTSVEGFSPPRRQQRKVAPTTTPKAASSRNLTLATTPKAMSSRNLTPATTPRADTSSDLFKATTPNPRGTSGLGKATTPNPRSSRKTVTTPRRAQTPRGTSSSRNVDKSSDSFNKFIRQMGKSGNIGDLCSLKEDEETSSRNVVPESLENGKNTKNLSRPSENSQRTSSLRHLIAQSPRKTNSLRNLVADSSRKIISSMCVNPESPRKVSSPRSVNPESPRRATSSKNVNPEPPRRATSSRKLNPESPRGTTSSRNLNRASLQKAGSSRNVKTASPLNAGRDLLKRAQSSRMMPSSDWNYEANRRHVATAPGDDPDNRDRDANNTSSRHLRIPSIDLC